MIRIFFPFLLFALIAHSSPNGIVTPPNSPGKAAAKAALASLERFPSKQKFPSPGRINPAVTPDAMISSFSVRAVAELFGDSLLDKILQPIRLGSQVLVFRTRNPMFDDRMGIVIEVPEDRFDPTAIWTVEFLGDGPQILGHVQRQHMRHKPKGTTPRNSRCGRPEGFMENKPFDPSCLQPKKIDFENDINSAPVETVQSLSAVSSPGYFEYEVTDVEPEENIPIYEYNGETHECRIRRAVSTAKSGYATVLCVSESSPPKKISKAKSFASRLKSRFSSEPKQVRKASDDDRFLPMELKIDDLYSANRKKSTVDFVTNPVATPSRFQHLQNNENSAAAIIDQRLQDQKRSQEEGAKTLKKQVERVWVQNPLKFAKRAASQGKFKRKKMKSSSRYSSGGGSFSSVSSSKSQPPIHPKGRKVMRFEAPTDRPSEFQFHDPEIKFRAAKYRTSERAASAEVFFKDREKLLKKRTNSAPQEVTTRTVSAPLFEVKTPTRLDFERKFFDQQQKKKKPSQSAGSSHVIEKRQPSQSAELPQKKYDMPEIQQRNSDPLDDVGCRVRKRRYGLPRGHPKRISSSTKRHLDIQRVGSKQ